MASTDYPAGRIVHLSGGCRAINPPGPKVTIEPSIIQGQVPLIELTNYGSIYKRLEQSGLKILGVDFIGNNLVSSGAIPPEWRPFHRTATTPWQSFEVQQKWSNIGHGAFENKDGRLWDTASRISYQLNACSVRLKEISDAYYNQLIGRIKSNDFKNGYIFEDGFTLFMYLALQSFLIDSCILRDYLAEFVCLYICEQKWQIETQILTTMSKLNSAVLQKHDINDALFQNLKSYCLESGWLFQLGSYRDLVVHSAPLARSGRKLFAKSDYLEIDNSVNVPQIYCHIPANPSEIRASRSNGNIFQDFESQFDVFVQAAKGDISKIDGLEYSWDVYGRLVLLSAMIAEYSPVEPKMMTFDDSNIIGPITVKYL